jgi:hypothetical protein
MTSRRAPGFVLALALLVLLAPSAAATGAHYVPRAGDGFHYSEQIVLGDGTGDYQGYSENTAITGDIGVSAVAPNGTESASYANTDSWSNSTGSGYSWSSSGTFTFSANSFLYVQGTDNQTGYTNPYVWFYVANTSGVGASVSLLNTPMSVLGTHYSYSLGSPYNEYVTAIFAEGNGSFDRNDVYGQFTATYNWKAYFDPSTGYILGYVYTEQDTNSSGDGFTITDTLHDTSTSFPLTPASGPSSSSSGSSFPYVLVGVILVVVVVVIIIAIMLSRSRRRTPAAPPLPRHSYGGNVGFGPPPGGAPPPIHLTPSGQPAVQQIVIRETVKVNCRYCGTLMDSTATVCPNCGAPRT